MSHEQEIWNKLLKLKTLPYGSVHCITDIELEAEVKNIISKVTYEGCLNDATVHNRFLEAYYDWITRTEVNRFTGLENFKAKAFSNGTTEAFDKFYLANKDRRLRYFNGEYMYHLVNAKKYFTHHLPIEDAPISGNDVVVFSLPFAGTGNEHPCAEKVLEVCDLMEVPVLVDCCYFGLCGDIDFNLDHSSIKAVTFSLSKTFPVQHLRIGMRLTREDDDDPLFVYNKNTYVNRLGAAVGLELVQRFLTDYNYNVYRKTQEDLCSQLGITPSKSVIFGNSDDLYPEYNRGTPNNRLCLSKYLKSGILPNV